MSKSVKLRSSAAATGSAKNSPSAASAGATKVQAVSSRRMRGCRLVVMPDSFRHPPFRERRRDRKSVVSGKSVSVRVDLGGRGIIKKNNITKQPTSHNIYFTYSSLYINIS